MLETPHVVVGAAIAVKVVNPALAIPLSFGSHFILEKVPHWNPHLNTETEKYGKPTRKSTVIVIVDASLALLAGSFIAYQMLPNIPLAITVLASCLAASLPDLVEAPHFFLNMRNNMTRKWIKIQKSIQSDTDVLPGLITQLATVIAAFFWIFN